MRFSNALVATLMAGAALAAPSEVQHPHLVDASASTSFMLSSSPGVPFFSWIHSKLGEYMPGGRPPSPDTQHHDEPLLRGEAQYASLEKPDYHDKTIWEVVQSDEHLSDLKKVLKYSGPGARKLLDDKSKKLTFLAPVNWHHHGHKDHEASLFKMDEWNKIEAQINMFEDERAGMFKGDKDRERKRKFLAYLIDATLQYHCIDAKEPLSAWDVAQNSSVASRLTIGNGRARDVLGNLMDGYPFRLRVGKSLLPRPSAYFNFYSRLVYPNVDVGGSILHAISLPLLIPPSALQALFFSSPNLAATVSALQKVHADGYFGYPINHTAIHHDAHALLPAAELNVFKEHQHVHHNNSHAHAHGHGQQGITLFTPSNIAWYRMPPLLRIFLLSPFGSHVLGKVLALHSLPRTIFYADFVHTRDARFQMTTQATLPAEQLTSSAEWLWGPTSDMPSVPFGDVDVTKYTFQTACPKLHFNHTDDKHLLDVDPVQTEKLEFETVDVAVYRYKVLPGGRGPLQTRVSVQNVSVTFQDIAVGNGALHVIERFIMPKEHPHKGIWAHAASEAEKSGFGTVDLQAENF